METLNKEIEQITMDDLIRVVKAMRFHQKRFRKSQKPAIKETLEPLEEEVDRICAQFLERQTKLF